MADRVFSAHPMLEPADYRLTPELAGQRMSGDQLAAYTLLWHAAVATLQDGPAIRRQHVLMEFSLPLSEPQYAARIQQDLVESPGWASGVLAGEMACLAPHRANSIPPQIQAQIDKVPTQLADYGWRVRSAKSLATVAGALPPPQSVSFKVVARQPGKLPMDALLEQMAQHHVGRPSTYASTIERALKNSVIDEGRDGLAVGRRGIELLELLGDHREAFGAQACNDLGEDLEDVEAGRSGAGNVLRKHAIRMLSLTPPLADWLDALSIEGESIEQAIDRATRRPPPIGGWSGLDLPAGIRPASIMANVEVAVALRDELDSALNEALPDHWRMIGARGRALGRLAALAWLSRPLKRASLSMLVRLGNRDLAYRWWSDLAPSEPPITRSELIAAMRPLRGPMDDWKTRRPSFLDELQAALG